MKAPAWVDLLLEIEEETKKMEKKNDEFNHRTATKKSE